MITSCASSAAAVEPPRPKPASRQRWIAWLQAAWTLTGCATYGPDAMRASREGYNEAVQVSDQRELLLNLVRLRYEEAPEFLAISGISTQMNFNAAASIGGEVGEVGNADVGFVSPGAAVAYSESPTITFVPRRDQDFTRQLVAPVELDSIYLLSRYGWGIDRLFLLIVSELNGLPNASGRERLSDANYEFQKIASELRELEKRNGLRVGVERRDEVLSDPIPTEAVNTSQVLEAVREGYRLQLAEHGGYLVIGERNHYVLAIDRGSLEGTVMDALELPVDRSIFELDVAGMPDAADLRLTTRSVLGSMAWLSNAVTVPPAHTSIVPKVASKAVPRSMMDIRVSAEPAKDAFLSVEHRGYWFYIDDRDLGSKRTLGLLTSLVRLTISAGGAQNVPVLTLPVGR